MEDQSSFERAVTHGRQPILSGGSIYERMRRRSDVTKDPHIAHASLLYDEGSRELLGQVHGEYIDVALDAGLPTLVLAGTWRAGRDRIGQSDFAGRMVNEDYVAFLREVAEARVRVRDDRDASVFFGGVLGPSGDAYRPEEGLRTEEAIALHTYQAEHLASADVDMLVAMTLPALPEATGLARAMASTGLPYMLSFMIRDSGTLLDGTPLAEAMSRVDDEVARPPVGYFANCVHPTVLASALDANPPGTSDRLLGLKANTSALAPEELAGQQGLLTAEPAAFADHMRDVQERFGLRILGGCCGTGTEHIREIAKRCGAPI